MYLSDELFMHLQDGDVGVYIPRAKRGINTKITLKWAQKQFVKRAYIYIILFTDNCDAGKCDI